MDYGAACFAFCFAVICILVLMQARTPRLSQFTGVDLAGKWESETGSLVSRKLVGFKWREVGFNPVSRLWQVITYPYQAGGVNYHTCCGRW